MRFSKLASEIAESQTFALSVAGMLRNLSLKKGKSTE